MAPKQDKVVSARFSSDELTQIDEAAQRRGITRSQYLREKALKAEFREDSVNQQPREVTQVPETLPDAATHTSDEQRSKELASQVAWAINPRLARIERTLQDHPQERRVSLNITEYIVIALVTFCAAFLGNEGPQIISELRQLLS